MPLHIYTDGSSLGNPGPSGWAAVFAYSAGVKVLSGAVSYGMAAQMELTAAYHALCNAAEYEIVLCSDSQMLIQGMTHLSRVWERNGWRKRDGRKLQYASLWQELLLLNRGKKIEWRWVRGHAQHPYQELADSYAYREACAERKRSRELRAA